MHKASAAVMAVAMADEEQPVFHDFLGMAGQRRRDGHGGLVQSKHFDGIQQQLHVSSSSSDKANLLRRSSSMNSGRHLEASVVVSEQLSWPASQRAHSCGGIQEIRNSNNSKPHISSDAYGQRHAKRKDMMVTDTRNHGHVQLQQQHHHHHHHQRGAEEDMGSTTPFPPKVRRAAESSKEQRSSKAMEEISMSMSRDESIAPSMMMMMMQPPPLWTANPLHQNVVHSGYGGLMPPKYMSMIRPPVVSALTEKSVVNNTNVSMRESAPSPADEGSRTGLKGSSTSMVSCLQNNTGNSNPMIPTGLSAAPPPPPPLGRSNSLNQANLSDSGTHISSSQQQQLQQTTPVAATTPSISRQLTIFYGGQAHVFEDVSSDKLDAIMALACSSGRSWSTTYNPRPEASGGSAASLTRLDGKDQVANALPLPQNLPQSSVNLASSSFHRQDVLSSSSLRPDSRSKALEAGLEVVNRM